MTDFNRPLTEDELRLLKAIWDLEVLRESLSASDTHCDDDERIFSPTGPKYDDGTPVYDPYYAISKMLGEPVKKADVDALDKMQLIYISASSAEVYISPNPLTAVPVLKAAYGEAIQSNALYVIVNH